MRIEIPAYIKITIILIGVYLGFLILHQAKQFIAMFLLSSILAMLLLPLNKKLEYYRFPRIVAILITIFTVFGLFFLIGLFIYRQLIRFVADFKKFAARLTELLYQTSGWFENYLGLEEGAIIEWFNKSFLNSVDQGTDILGTTISFTTGAFYFIGITPIFIFFMLYYRDFFKKFVLMLFNESRHRKIQLVFKKTELVIQNYLTGLLIVISIISTLNVIGLTILGVKFSLFFGVLAGALNIIPYIGVFIGSLLPIIFTYVTEGSLFKPLGVAAIMWIIQFVEGNFITPNIIGSKVSLNPFAAIIALIVGGMLWGPVGMILFIPLTAVAKVLCDSIETLKPYGYLLGEPEPYLRGRNNSFIRKLRGKVPKNPRD